MFSASVFPKINIFLGLCVLLAGHASLAHADDDVLRIEPDRLNTILRATPMPELDDSRIGKILGRYYKEGLGGAENWEKIESLRVSGTLTLEDGAFRLSAFQKKPTLIKISLQHRRNNSNLVLGYDGEVAWKQLPGQAEATEMAPIEARRFIHSAHFGNHLLYPYAEGKTIRYVDTVPVEGNICHQIRVELDTGYRVDYFIDIRSYLEIKVENTDLRNDFTNSLLYKDYIREFGMPVAKQVESYEEGEWVSSLSLDEVKVNTGLMPWMFHMP